MNKTIVATFDTPGRKPGLRPSVETQLLQIHVTGQEISVACAVQDDGSLLIVLHHGSVTIKDNR